MKRGLWVNSKVHYVCVLYGNFRPSSEIKPADKVQLSDESIIVIGVRALCILVSHSLSILC